MKTAAIVGVGLLAVPVLMATSAAPTYAGDTAISTRVMKVKDRTDPAKGRIKRDLYLFSKDSAITIPAEESAGDPLVNGGAVQIVNTAGTGEVSALIPLPAENWWRIPQDPNGGLRGWKYQERVKNPPTEDLRIKILFKQNAIGTEKLLKIKVKDRAGSVIDYTLDEESQGSIGVRFFSGVDQHCADSAGALNIKDREKDRLNGAYVGSFAAKEAPAPADCNLGSPSKAFLDVTSGVLN